MQFCGTMNSILSSLVFFKLLVLHSQAKLIKTLNPYERSYTSLNMGNGITKDLGKYSQHLPVNRIPLPVNLIDTHGFPEEKRRVEDNSGHSKGYDHLQNANLHSHVPETSHKHHTNSEHKQHQHHKKVEKDSSLDDLLEVMGPHLFLIPFVAKVIPFAVPAVPLSYILTRYAPATLEEIQERFMEILNQIREFIMQQQEMQGG